MDKKIKEKIISLLKKGEDIPASYQEDLFPVKKKEYKLIYSGKEREEKILNDTMSIPFQPVKHFGEAKENTWSNMLIFGDNLQSLKHLLKLKEEGKLKNSDGTSGVKLVYIDPPFATKREFQGNKGQKAYQDRVIGSQYIEFIRKRLILLKELLSDDGSIYVQLDMKKHHYIKILLDELFGEENFVNEVIWKRTFSHGDSGQGAKHLGRLHDVILIYKKSDKFILNPKYTPYSEKYLKDFYKYKDKYGRIYRLVTMTGPGGASKGNPRYEVLGVTRYWMYSKKRMDELIKNGEVVQTNPGTVPQRKKYVDEAKGVPLQDIWIDIAPIQGVSLENLRYPTQKPELLMERIIKLGSNQGDLILDCFAGAGSTGAVAEKLGRKWIMCDCGKLSIYIMQKRLINLKKDIGNKGKSLKHKPFTLYHAGLYYEGEILEKMRNEEYKDFVLELFGCQKRNHKINGIDFHGTLNNHSAMIFNKENYLTKDFIKDLHKNIGSSVKDLVYLIAPVGIVGFNEDYVSEGKIKYTILRIPNSIINYIREKDFTKLEQPRTSQDVNQTIDAVGFDFIYPPHLKANYYVEKPKEKLSEKEYVVKIEDFDPIQLGTKIIEFNDPKSEALSMVMVDLDYDGDTFEIDKYIFGDEIVKNNFKVEFGEKIGKQIMVIYIDIFGNERKEVIEQKDFKEK